jgi:integrase
MTLRLPKYRHYKPKDLAVVRIDGRDIYLGKYNSPESWERYRRVIAEWLATRRLPSTAVRPGETETVSPSISELILAFWICYAEVHYRRDDGSPSGELGNYRDSLRLLRQLYGSTSAGEFGPMKLKALRQTLIDAGLSRTTINQRIGRIVRLFKWAASEELIPAGVYQALTTVAGLPRGRSGAREAAPVEPVPDELVEAVRPHVARQVWAMIELQRLTGMRPGEVVIMRTGDLDRGGEDWVYTPRRHKTEHRGKRRRIPLGPRARAVVAPWLRADPSEYLFQPREAMAEFRAEQRRSRKTPLYPSQRARQRKPDPKYAPGDHYSTRTYHHAIGYGCRRAGIASWHPNQLRHAAATRIRRAFDLEAARAVLGHSDLKTSEIYAERDEGIASAVAQAIG